ncbi:MAG: 2-dehydropantoate 2-reductase [Pseudomonadota bacterium]
MIERIAVVGAGAVGGHVAAYMARAGHDVTLIDAWPAHVDQMKQKGLTLKGSTEPECFTTPVRALHITDLQSEGRGRGFDIVFLSTKSYDTRWATEMIRDYLAPEGFVVSLQNAINEPTIAEVVGWGRTVGAIASKISVELDAPGHITRLVKLGGQDHTVFRVGECHGRETPRAKRVAQLLGHADSAMFTPNLWGERWSKLCVNCMRNPIAASTGRGGNENDRDPIVRRLSIQLATEAAIVGQAHGFQFEKLYGIAVADLIAAKDGDEDALARCEAAILDGTKTRAEGGRASMGQDIAKGRRTEIDYLNGYVVRQAKAAGLAAPTNAAIVKIVQRVARGEVAASPDLLTDI